MDAAQPWALGDSKRSNIMASGLLVYKVVEDTTVGTKQQIIIFPKGDSNPSIRVLGRQLNVSCPVEKWIILKEKQILLNIC